MLDSNIRGNSPPHYILGLTTQITPCSPRPDAVATRIQSSSIYTIQPAAKPVDNRVERTICSFNTVVKPVV